MHEWFFCCFMRYFNNIATPIKWPVKVPLGRIAWQNTQEQSILVSTVGISNSWALLWNWEATIKTWNEGIWNLLWFYAKEARSKIYILSIFLRKKKGLHMIFINLEKGIPPLQCAMCLDCIPGASGSSLSPLHWGFGTNILVL